MCFKQQYFELNFEMLLLLLPPDKFKSETMVCPFYDF